MSRPAVLGCVLVLSACTVPGPSAEAMTWIGIYAPQNWSPPEMSLEIGAEAWAVTPIGRGGVVTPAIDRRTSVRLVGIDDCRLYAEFDISPGAGVAIRFSSDGSVRLEDNADGARELGPGLIETEPTDCDQPRSTD